MTQTTGTGAAWIRRFHPSDDAPVRLVCFPHAGGSASFYFPVSRTLAPSVDVLAVQYPGRQDRRLEPSVSDMNELADLVAEQLRPWTDKPLALFGHSMGAMLAFEVARRLESEGVRPLVLFASGRRAPMRRRGNENVHVRDDEQLIEELKTLSGTDSQILGDPEVLHMILPAIRSDYRAVETYRYQPGPPLATPIVALTGDSDAQVTLDEAEDWAQVTSGGFQLKVYEGGHFYLNAQAAAVIAEIRSHLRAPSLTGSAAADH
ncbi:MULTISPECIES: thioesterase II family protein [unclassified Streptomyces]|uniref:thioesterase II family protein n=1 Tax=unclassified Streptomyces TaxID=2593676 RepID=UPI0004C4F283|nr:alpha/beta fold hydrolase [Streptomyces sp. NRRL F-2747]